MSLLTSKELFERSAFPVAADTLIRRTFVQKELHRHEYFEMLFAEREGLTNRFRNEEVVLHPGDVLIMKPYVLHVLEDRNIQSNRRAWCCSFLPEAIDSSIHSLEDVITARSPNAYFFRSFFSLAEEGISAVRFSLNDEVRKEFAALFSLLRDATYDASQRGAALTRCRFMDLMAFLSDWDEMQGNSPCLHEETKDLSVSFSRYRLGLQKTLNYVHVHFNEALPLKKMAAMTGASETYFCRLFKHQTGMTFLNYVNGLRIERACELLHNTCLSASDICYSVGYNDYAHFGRQFKKNTGLSPAAYRRQREQIIKIREDDV